MNGRRAALLGAVVLGVIGCFQLALVLGAPWGSITQGGFDDGQLAIPGRVVAAGSALITTAFACGLLGRAGLGPLDRHWRTSTIVTWACLVYSGLGTLMNLASQSALERLIWTPVCIVLAACAWATLRGTQRRRPNAK